VTTKKKKAPAKEGFKQALKSFRRTFKRTERTVGEIDMSDPAHRERAMALATGSTEATRWGSLAADELIHSVRLGDRFWFVGGERTGILTTASQWDAEFFVNAKAIVLGLMAALNSAESKLRSRS
jgi:hypothetical protein